MSHSSTCKTRAVKKSEAATRIKQRLPFARASTRRRRANNNNNNNNVRLHGRIHHQVKISYSVQQHLFTQQEYHQELKWRRNNPKRPSRRLRHKMRNTDPDQSPPQPQRLVMPSFPFSVTVERYQPSFPEKSNQG